MLKNRETELENELLRSKNPEISGKNAIYSRSTIIVAFAGVSCGHILTPAHYRKFRACIKKTAALKIARTQPQVLIPRTSEHHAKESVLIRPSVEDRNVSSPKSTCAYFSIGRFWNDLVFTKLLIEYLPPRVGLSTFMSFNKLLLKGFCYNFA